MKITKNTIELILFVLLFSGCAALEEPRWVLLSDTDEKAFYLDREKVERLANGNYLYPVKVCLYREGQTHELDESHDTNRVLSVEMNCRQKHWTEKGSGFVGKDGKVLFRSLNPIPTVTPIQPNTVHLSAYNYLCDEDSFVAQHDHP